MGVKGSLKLIDRLQGWLIALRSPQPSAGKLSHGEQEALVQQLAGDRPAERWLAAEALCGSNLSAAALRGLTAVLSSDDPMLRWEAAAALGRSGSVAARKALLDALAATDPRTQAAAADGLGLWPAEPETLAALTAALASPHAAVRQSAAEALARLAARPAGEEAPAPGQESVPPLLDLLQSDPEVAVRRAAALALGRIGDPAAAEALAACEADPQEDTLVREAAAVALTRLRAPSQAPEQDELVQGQPERAQDVEPEP